MLGFTLNFSCSWFEPAFEYWAKVITVPYRLRLVAPSVAHLCKSVIMENTHFTQTGDALGIFSCPCLSLSLCPRISPYPLFTNSTHPPLPFRSNERKVLLRYSSSTCYSFCWLSLFGPIPNQHTIIHQLQYISKLNTQKE